MSTSSPISLSQRAMPRSFRGKRCAAVYSKARRVEAQCRPAMPTTVSQLFIYPVKGLQAIAVPSARCTERGFEHDRRFMVVDAQGRFMSQREFPLMATVWTEIGHGMLVLS